MENLDKYSPIQLQKMGNDIKTRHDVLKKEIIAHLYEIEELEKKINDEVTLLQKLEDEYINIIEKLAE